MKFIKKIWGKILNGLGKIISAIFGVFIAIVSFLVQVVVGIGRGALAIISMGGILFIFLLGPTLLFNPIAFVVILFLIIFPILGTKFISYLKYVRYMVTEYLFDHGDNFLKGRKAQFKTINEYGRKYRRMEEERKRRERRRRQEAQQREWEERFRQWSEYQSYRGGGFGGQGWNGQGSSGYRGQTYANPNIEFKSKYEQSCDLLGVAHDADKYQIKLGFRKKAKEYHPDINKSPNATQKFQQINDAYEFLSDSNIERYKKLR